MKIQDFFKKYPDEASCKAHFKSERDRQGVVCKRCQCQEHYWLPQEINTNVKAVSLERPYVAEHCFINPNYHTTIGILE